jgi:hypothetical protein
MDLIYTFFVCLKASVSVVDEVAADFLSGAFKGSCFSDDNCKNTCQNADKAKGGHCSTWGGKCWCDQ